MKTTAVGLSAAGFLVVIGTFVAYFRTIPRNKVPVQPAGWILTQIFGMILAVLAIISSFRGNDPTGLTVYGPAMIALLLGSAFLWLMSQRKTPAGDLKVKIGDKLLPFEAVSSDGAEFHSDSLLGKRTLLKFFRGGWCPYCAAELSRFEALLADLGKYGVSVVALSKDTAAEAAIHKARDNLNLTLLSDVNLDVIRQYGIEHHKALGQNKTPATLIGGIPFGLSPLSFKTMAIPTTLLVDEQGTVLWIDQTDDYRLRSSEARVLDAVRAAFN